MTAYNNVRQSFIFIAIIVLNLFLCLNMVSAKDILSIRIDSDNSGTIENSPKENAQANCPHVFGKFIPYNAKTPEYVEFQICVPASADTNTKRFLQLDLGSNEVSLWGKNNNDGKKHLYTPSASCNTQKETKNVTSNNPNEKNNNFNIGSFLNINLDKTEDNPIQDQDVVSTETEKRVPYLIPLDNKEHTYTFYLSATTGSQNSTWTLSKTNRRPTRTLTATIMLQKNKKDRIQKTSQQVSCQYIVVDNNSIYKSIFEKEILSEIVATWAVYYTDSNKWTDRYGLTEVDKTTLKQWGFTEQELEEFFQPDEGFRVRFYRDWVHNKYYVAFKGTDIQASFLGDMTNNALLCAGRFSPYLKKALLVGAIIHERFPKEVRNKCVIVGHSLGGALASGAGIVSQRKTVVFNALGLTYSTLDETTRLYFGDDTKTNKYIRSRIEECFPGIPNSSIRKYDTSKALLSYFNTKYDLLNVAADEIYGPETSDDILPSALGVPYFSENKNVTQYQDDKVDQVRNLARQINRAIQEHPDNPAEVKQVFQQMITDSFPKDTTSLSQWFQKGTELIQKGAQSVVLINQLEFALEQHSLDVVVQELLAQYNSSPAFAYTSIDYQYTPSTTSNCHGNIGYQQKEKDIRFRDMSPEEIHEFCRGLMMFGKIFHDFAQAIATYQQREEEKKREMIESANLLSKHILYIVNIISLIILFDICFGEFMAHKHCYNYEYEQLQPKPFILQLLTFTGRCSQTKYKKINDIIRRFSFFPFIFIMIPSIDSGWGLLFNIIGVLFILVMCSSYVLRLHDINKSAFRLLPFLIFCNILWNGASVMNLCYTGYSFMPIFVPWIFTFFFMYFIESSNYFRELLLPRLLDIPGTPYMNIYGIPEPESENEVNNTEHF